MVHRQHTLRIAEVDDIRAFFPDSQEVKKRQVTEAPAACAANALSMCGLYRLIFYFVISDVIA